MHFPILRTILFLNFFTRRIKKQQMHRKALLTLIIVLFATTFSSCSRENVTPAIILDFETEHNSDFSALSENYPLPEEIAVFYSDLPTDTPEDTYELLARITLTSIKP